MVDLHNDSYYHVIFVADLHAVENNRVMDLRGTFDART